MPDTPESKPLTWTAAVRSLRKAEPVRFKPVTRMAEVPHVLRTATGTVRSIEWIPSTQKFRVEFVFIDGVPGSTYIDP